ncbi:MAG TPA: hypothetical protein VGR11_16000 [Solirubrobacteraceae bacterium]|nr:hypothetical protein [Solirubrobacteraceae bacterium]
MPRVAAAGSELHHEPGGRGAPLLLLIQRMGATGTQWGEPFLTELERDFDLVASLIPRARLELLEGAGHLFFREQPQRSVALVRRFALDARVLSSP